MLDFWVRISRSILMVVGLGALLLAAGNLTTGGASITDPVMPGGVILGLVALGAGAWTFERGGLRAAIVWLGVAGIVGAIGIIWVRAGGMHPGDRLIYVGIPTAIVLLAAMGVAVGRVRAGPFGAPTSV